MISTRRIPALVGSLLLCFTLITQTACPKKSRTELIQQTRTVIAAFNEALPVLQSAGIDVTRLHDGLTVADRLLTAFEQNDGASAFQLTAQVIDAFKDVVASCAAISDQGQRTTILAILAVAQIGLRVISQNLKSAAQNLPAAQRTIGGSGDAQAVALFASSKKWRCRDSASGRWASMDYCRQNPATSEVEVR